ncbi:cysteine-rich motor neuron 1 protein-like [Physella acuta]|uniref:cysteine-rich motor neuron 1 protein-like n=1 Tax=Physella acuta TaxID=109671 RepID=UPI0027DDD651|nr:cysteine-rich motor neuron 1 protein-like [Physella acuta]
MSPFFLPVTLTVVCWSVNGASTGPGCESDGALLHTGNSFKPSACQYCTCQSSGQVTCITLECAHTRCEKFETPPGACCPICVDDGPLIII